MKLLITGVSGQLGTDCKSVLESAHHVAGFDIPEFDITDHAGCLKKLDEYGPEVIVNCAAYTAVDACEKNPVCWKVNAAGPKYLAEWAAANGAFLVHISTDYVFDGKKPLFEAYIETDAPAPLSEYGRSKLAGEQAVLGGGAQFAILRTAWLYGAHGKNFLKTMLRLALQNPEKEIRVVNDQFGSPTWSRTLARQIAAVINIKATGIFHATSEGYCSWYDLAKYCLSLMDVPHSIIPCTTADYPTPARRPENSILKNAALEQQGLNVFKNWESELQQFVGQYGGALMAEVKGILK
jgi:dTDP-4-dehydrorhamnose reductase